LPQRSKPLRDVLSREEITLLEDVLPSERDRLIIRIFGDYGLRLDELAKIAPEDIIRFNRQGYIRVLGKRNRQRDVPIPPLLLRRLERFIERRPTERTADRVFCRLAEHRTACTSRRRSTVCTTLLSMPSGGPACRSMFIHIFSATRG
jgi:integrase